MNTFSEALASVVECPVENLETVISSGKITEYITILDEHGRTLAMMDILTYLRYEKLVSLGCRIDGLVKNKYFGVTDNLGEYLINQKRKGLPKITIDCSIRNISGNTFLNVYSSNMEYLIDQNLINFDDDAKKNAKENIVDPVLLKKIDDYFVSVTNESAKGSETTKGSEFDEALNFIQRTPIDLLSTLIDKKVININARSRKGFSLLDRDMPFPAFKLLVEKGCDIVVVHNGGLFVYVSQLFSLLISPSTTSSGNSIKVNIDCSIKNKHGNSFLLTAFDTDKKNITPLEMLLDQNLINFNPSEKEENGMTILHQACKYGASLAAIKKLLGMGADPSIKDDYGKVAIDYAKSDKVKSILITPLANIISKDNKKCQECAKLQKEVDDYKAKVEQIKMFLSS